MELALTTSNGLADAVADALGMAREAVRLHLQSIRAAGEITFKGYGRGAAAMTPLDSARLLIAVTGSTFAKDAMTVLANFAKLKSMKARARETTLEAFLGERIGAMPGERHFPTPDKYNPRAFGRSTRPLETSVKLMWIAREPRTGSPRFAVVRWMRADGGQDFASFASDKQPARLFDEDWIAENYPDERGIIQSRTVPRRALEEISEAILD